MRSTGHWLINTADIEIWPGGLLRARANRDARALARARHVLRRKRDGRYLAADLPEGLLPLVQRLMREPGVDEALDALESVAEPCRMGLDVVGELPLAQLLERLESLGLDEGYGERTGLPLVAEPDRLALAGFDRYRRPLWLHPQAARAWNAMREGAYRDGIVLEAISGYRSHDYQLGIFERKLARGLTVDDILAVNAAPGYSEHHSGRALDIGAPDEPPAEESFEDTAAFGWLGAKAGDYGFAMSYPRGNPHGIVYEPWHWYCRLPGE
ncbi:D-alanyl-D-alanine carboxypeptidase family protein [Luteimonas sp. SX5]|uniref:D-alanyl-D-alanine carboxypeptidase family protein n=1 Tax=Luteimonas galliterrae TaxID=2940486 RepID=A0ABT0MGY2_9GAMM|nr:M15 family metallopeptidase [Luteimonas galliterrae]MCL1634119.1 D-alanyl-D-alanine carboxypeptidase family protein [Luteimonas galliterrae]